MQKVLAMPDFRQSCGFLHHDYFFVSAAVGTSHYEAIIVIW
jgi:hypothetical protein